MFKKAKNKAKRGFTLIELIIVIAIIAILAAIAVPAFGEIRENSNKSSDLSNARTIYGLVAADVADGTIKAPTTKTEITDSNGAGLGLTDVPKVLGDYDEKDDSTSAGGNFSYEVDDKGNIKVFDNVTTKQLYPTSN